MAEPSDPAGPPRVLILLSASFPFGPSETFLASEFPWLEEAYDEVVIVSNDTTSGQAWPVGPDVTMIRRPYELGTAGKLRALAGLLSPSVWRELSAVGRHHGIRPSRRVVSTVLASRAAGRSVARLLRDLARERPDAEVHAYSYWANDMALGAAEARRRGWVDRAFARAHRWDVFFDENTGVLPFRNALATELDHLLFISDDGRRWFEAHTDPGARSALGVRRLGTAAVSDGPLADRNPFTVVSCSSLISLKRVHLVAQALARVEHPVRWVHAGDGPERGRVEALLRDLPDHVEAELRGHLAHDDVAALYRDLRPSVLVNVSEIEGVPVSMMEAMAFGVPVIGTDVGAVREIVTDGRNGVLLSPDPEPDEIARAIGTFASMPDEDFRRYARNAWTTWKEGYDVDDAMKDFLRRVMRDRADG